MKDKTQKRLVSLGTVFVVLLALFFSRNKINSLFETQITKTFQNIKPSDIQEITVTDGTDTTSIYKKKNIWYTKKDTVEYLADTSRIDTLITAIIEMSKDNVISNNKNKRKEFDIGTQKVIFKSGKTTHTILVGKPINTKNYIAVDQDSDVFTAEGFSAVFFPLDYRDLTVHVLRKPENISSLTISYDDISLHLDKKNNAWFINDKIAKQERLDYFFNDLQTLKADTFADKNAINGLSSEMTVIVKEKDQETKAEFYPYTPETYLISVSSIPYIYEIKTAYIQSLKKAPTDFTE